MRNSILKCISRSKQIFLATANNGDFRFSKIELDRMDISCLGLALHAQTYLSTCLAFECSVILGVPGHSVHFIGLTDTLYENKYKRKGSNC